MPESWVDRLAIVGDPQRGREQLATLQQGGVGHAVLIPAYPDIRSGLDSLARLLE